MCIFEAFETVKVVDSQKLFFKKFPFKVNLSIPDHLIFRRGLSWPSDVVILRNRRTKFVNTCSVACPNDKSRWRVSEYARSISYFFEFETDALAFVEDNLAYVSQVDRPASSREQAIMASDAKVVVRNSLFWGSFPWAIHFKWLKPEVEAEVTELVATYFAAVDTPEERYHYSESSQPRLYVQHEDDVVMMKMVLSKHIQKIEKAIVRSELT